MIIDFGNDQKGGGGRAPIIEALSITANGTYEAPKEIDGYSPVNVDVKAKVQEVSVTYTQNGVNEIVPDQGMDGISKATVTVNVPDPYLVPLVATENKTYNPGPDEDGFSSVEVNVPQTSSGPLRLADHTNIRIGCSPFTTFTNDDFDFSGVRDMEKMFRYCDKLEEIPVINTSGTFYMSQCFSNCSALKSIPQLDTSNVVDMSFCFENCIFLETIGTLDASNVKNMNFFLRFSKNITNLGGFLNLKVSLDLSGGGAYYAPKNLTKESVMNVINNVAQADPAFEAQPKLTFCSKVYALLTPDDIAIATGKGWTVVDAGY